MKNFFLPSSFKIKLAFALIVYCLIGLVFISSFSTSRNKGKDFVELNVIERAVVIVGYPAVVLVSPFYYIGKNVLTTQTTLYELMKESGCTNCDEKQFKEPIQTSTSLGVTIGVLVEVLFLYCLACFVSFFINKRRNRI